MLIAISDKKKQRTHIEWSHKMQCNHLSVLTEREKKNWHNKSIAMSMIKLSMETEFAIEQGMTGKQAHYGFCCFFAFHMIIKHISFISAKLHNNIFCTFVVVVEHSLIIFKIVHNWLSIYKT